MSALYTYMWKRLIVTAWFWQFMGMRRPSLDELYCLGVCRSPMSPSETKHEPSSPIGGE